MGRSCRCSALFYKEDSSLWASQALVVAWAPASAVLSAHVQVIAAVDAVVLFDDAWGTAVAACLVDGVWSVAVAYGLVHVDHLIGDLLYGLVHEDPPFGSLHRGLPFGSAHGGHPFGLVHEGHPFELEHEGPPSRMVWCPGPLVAAACCQVLHY